jgi:glycosyltransferase involved in cell wall biosynthesis
MNRSIASRRLRHVLYTTTERWVDFDKQEGVPVHLMHRQRHLESLGIRMSWARFQRRPPAAPPANRLAEGFSKAWEVASTLSDARQVLRQAKPLMRDIDLVHEWYSLYGLAGLRLARRFRKPLVLEVDALLIEEYTGLHGIRLGRLRAAGASACLRANLSAASRIIVRSRVMAEVLQRNWGVGLRRIAVIPCALDLDKFRGLPRPDPDGRPPTVMFLGSLQPWHGCDVLLEAFAALVGSGSAAQLSIIGDGKQRSKLAAQAATLGLEGRVTFHGSVSHERIPVLLSQATVTVAPYPQLAVPFYFSPMKLFEYMGAQTAIAASRIGQIGEVLTDGESALLVRPGDAQDLARALRRLLDEPALRKRLAARARALAEGYTYPRQAQAIRDVYRQALEAAP